MTRQGSDPDRLQWIREQRCALHGQGCEGRIDPHHRTGAGMALRAPDDQAFPLCRKHHRARHDLAGHFAGWEKARVKLWELEMVDRYQDLYSASLFSPSGVPPAGPAQPGPGTDQEPA